MTETLDDLLREQIDARTLTAWSRAAGIDPTTVQNLRVGKHKPQLTTRHRLARALGLPLDRIDAAIDASRLQATEGGA